MVLFMIKLTALI